MSDFTSSDKDRVIIIARDNDFILGGEETYYLRMVKWANSNKIKICIAIEENCSISNSWQQEMLSQEFNILRYRFSGFGGVLFKENISKLIDGKSVVILTSRIHTLVQFSVWRDQYSDPARIKVIHYVLHPYYSAASQRKIFNFPYRRYLLHQFGKNIIFMDEQTHNIAEEYYKKEIPINQYYRLGCFVPKLDEQVISKKLKNNKRKVLVMSRFDFPFKGYVIGVIKECNEVLEKYKDVNFSFIGSGKGSSEFEQYYLEVERKYPHRVEWIKGVSYDSLPDYFHDCYCFMGMGTSLLDAAKTGTPGLVACCYTRNADFRGWWNDNPKVLGEYASKSIFVNDLVGFVDEMMSWDDEEYIHKSVDSYIKFKELYDINTIMPQILNVDDPHLKVPRCLATLDNLLYICQRNEILKRKHVKN